MNLHEVLALPERDGLPPPPKHQWLHAGMRSGAAGSAEGQDWEFFSRAFAVKAAARCTYVWRGVQLCPGLGSYKLN